MVLTIDSPHSRFHSHVSFDNFGSGEATEKNTLSFTLNVRHRGYQHKRRSRTFMVGIDENSYSDIALQWMLEELVDDGDEIICLRVVDKDSKITTDRNLEKKQYQQEARELMESIQKKNDENRAISIVLEFAVGKVHTTFQSMVSLLLDHRVKGFLLISLQIQIYEPAMLIVGTRGRSLGGFQGLVSNRNSFSKWCLQYSPIPVVVVRPTEKRLKKKQKRDADPSRQDYARILKDSGVDSHETALSTSNFEVSNDPDDEAHAVAAALGLPAAFDPTVKPYVLEGSKPLRKTDSGKSEATSISSIGPESRPSSPGMVMKSPKLPAPRSPALSAEESEAEDDEEEEEGEFETVSGHTLLGNDADRPEVEKKKKLHEMEVGEAAALAAGRKISLGSTDDGSPPAETQAEAEDEDEDEDEDS